MPTTIRDFILETLTHSNIDRINYHYGPMRVYPSGYKQDIASCMRNNRIQISTNPTSIGRPSPAIQLPEGSFDPTTSQGISHIFFINSRYCESRGDGLYLNQALSPQELASLRGTIIHESTQALQDWQQIQLSPTMAEGVAYLAGAIARRLWGDSLAVVNPRAGGPAYALESLASLDGNLLCGQIVNAYCYSFPA